MRFGGIPQQPRDVAEKRLYLDHNYSRSCATRVTSAWLHACANVLRSHRKSALSAHSRLTTLRLSGIASVLIEDSATPLLGCIEASWRLHLLSFPLVALGMRRLLMQSLLRIRLNPV